MKQDQIDGFDHTWDQCAMPGCRGPRDGGARFCAPCFRESIRSQEKYELDAHKALSALFVTPDPPAPVLPAKAAPAEAKPEPEPEPGVLEKVNRALERLTAFLDTGRDAPESEPDPESLEAPALDEPPPTDYRTPADGYGEAEPYRPPFGSMPGNPYVEKPAVASRELHGSPILELGPRHRAIVTVDMPGRFACADVHGFRLWIPGAATLAEYEGVALVNVNNWGCIVYGNCGGPGAGTPASHYLRLRPLTSIGGDTIRMSHAGNNNILFEVENLTDKPVRLGVILDLTGYDKEPRR